MWLGLAITSLIDAMMCSLDVFFIISGFLITQLLFRERDLNGTVDLKAFYVRRLLRIWPLYFFIIGIAFLPSAFDRSQASGWLDLLSFVFFAGNWGPVLGHWPHAVILVPLWSVSFEEQFYLLWPLVLRRASRKFIYGTAIGLLGRGRFGSPDFALRTCHDIGVVVQQLRPGRLNRLWNSACLGL